MVDTDGYLHVLPASLRLRLRLESETQSGLRLTSRRLVRRNGRRWECSTP